MSGSRWAVLLARHLPEVTATTWNRALTPAPGVSRFTALPVAVAASTLPARLMISTISAVRGGNFIRATVRNGPPAAMATAKAVMR